jgi:catechol 2,3-dioxygenase-like lactoylglutathione lyase family enzyme
VIERTDFMSVPVEDMERAKRFFSETLGIHSPNLEDGWPEFDGETVDTGVCHMAFFKDPDGNALMLHRRYAPRD